jgi:hypothetical protein
MVDQIFLFCYNSGIQSKKEFAVSFIVQYCSPVTETSVIKNVPIKHLVHARSEVRDAFPGRRVIARFRGPRHDSMALYCTKKNARTFAIYVS